MRSTHWRVGDLGVDVTLGRGGLRVRQRGVSLSERDVDNVGRNVLWPEYWYVIIDVSSKIYGKLSGGHLGDSKWVLPGMLAVFVELSSGAGAQELCI